MPMPEEMTPIPEPQPEVPEETLPPTFAPVSATPDPTITPVPTLTPTPVPAPIGTPAPTQAPRVTETPKPQTPELGSGTRNWIKYPLYDDNHPDRRLNVPADPDCLAPIAGTPSLLSLEDPVSI